jgi:Cu+-exporting ATPase
MLGPPAHLRGMTDTNIQVSGMSCRSCVSRVDRALRALDGVHEVQVDLRAGIVRVRHTDGVTADTLADGITRAGYPSQPAAA